MVFKDFWHSDETQTDNTTPGQSEPGIKNQCNILYYNQLIKKACLNQQRIHFIDVLDRWFF